MVERLMILKTTPDETKEHRFIKSDSMNTDDDDSVLSNDQQTNLSESQTSLIASKDQLSLSAPQLQQTPSFEFSNDQDENPLETKIKKKKQRRMTDQVRTNFAPMSSFFLFRPVEKEEDHRWNSVRGTRKLI